VSLRSLAGTARRGVLSKLYRKPVPLRDCGPIVSFTFDDFPRTALTVGGPILERYGARGTYYTAMGLMNMDLTKTGPMKTSSEVGDQFRREDLETLLEHGHELASHTFTHISSRSVSRATFCQDVSKGIDALKKSTGEVAANFAYPFGDVALTSKRALQPGARNNPGVTSARGIIPGLNGPEIDLSLLRANSLYGDVDRASRAEELIAENMIRKTWLIFYTHDVSPNPSPYGCTPELLEAAISCAARSASRILTVREALAEIGAITKACHHSPRRIALAHQ
jgi:peptidoglycan/xylan/chitin deacetylase (PgdA/CDA1 family)